MRKSAVTVVALALALVSQATQIGAAAARPELVAQTGHTNAIDSIAFSRDGALVASGGHDAAIKLWDVRTGMLVRTLGGHTNVVSSLTFTVGNKQLVSGSMDGTIKIWEIESGQTVRNIQFPVGVNALALGPDGRTLAACGLDPDVILFDLATGEEIRRLRGHTKVVNAVAFSPDGKLVATASNDNTIKLWETSSGREVRNVPMNTRRDQALQVIDPTTNRPMPMPASFNTQVVTSVSFSPDGRRLATSNYDLKNTALNGIAFSVTLIDVATGQPIRTLDSFMGGGDSLHFIFDGFHNPVAGIPSFSPQGATLLAPGNNYSIRLWDINTGRLLKSLPVIDLGADPDKARDILAKFQALRWDPPHLPTFSPDGKTVAIAVENAVTLWDVASAKPIHHLGAHADSIHAVSFNPSGTSLASSSQVFPTRLWDLIKGGSRVVERGTFPDGALALDFSGGQDLLVTGAMDISDSIVLAQLWDSQTGKKRTGFAGYSAGFPSISLSSDGKKIAIGRIDDAVTLFDVESGQKLRTFEKTAFTSNAVALSADGRILAYAASGNLQMQVKNAQPPENSPDVRALMAANGTSHITVWNTETGTELLRIQEINESYGAIAISRDGKFLAGSGAKTYVWDIDSGRSLQVFNHATSCVAFSPDESMLAACAGNEIFLWNIKTGKEIAKLSGKGGGVNSVAFSRQGTRLASGSYDGAVTLWDLDKKEEIVALFAVDKKDYLISTPEDYYMASRTGLGGVAFRVGNHAYPFEQFDLRFNRPDLVLKRLGAASADLIEGYHTLALMRLKRANLDEQMLTDDFHLPEVRVLDPGLPLSSTKPVIRFSVEATDSLYDLDHLNIYIDGVPVYGTSGLSVRARRARTVRQEVQVPLSTGKNEIQVSVVNTAGAESLAETAVVRFTGPEPESKLYVLTVGVSGYKDPDTNLKYGAQDAQAQEQYWKSSTGLFRLTFSKMIEDRNATKDNIKQAKSFLEQAGVNDMVVVFLAGHGALDSKGKYYFGTWNINLGKPEQNGLAYEDILGLLDGISARRKLLLIDTCYSGTPDDGLLQSIFADLSRGTGAEVIAAANQSQMAMEANEFNGGLFTHAVLEGLKGLADADADGRVSISELREYVIAQVELLSHGRQKASVRAENVVQDFALSMKH